MPDPIIADPATSEVTETVTPTETPEIDYKAETEKWKALSRQNEAAAKANAEKAKSFDLLEESNKTEQQRLSERAERAEKALADKETETARALVALDKGLTARQAARLVGNTREELLADADQLLADIGKPSSAPKADPSQGIKATGTPQDPASAFAEALNQARGR